MTVFYRGPRARITHTTLEVWCPCYWTYRTFVIRELRHVYVVEGESARSRTYELRALHRGEPLRLFATADAREFGQVKRALQRAIEQLAEA